MKNQTPAERAFLEALESPVPSGLLANVQRAARREVLVRAWRRAVAWAFVPAAAAAALIIAALQPNRAPEPPAQQPPVAQHPVARTLISLAAGGTTFSEEADVHTLAQDLLNLQGF